ncbi:MAG: efflux RND transporter permease subunit, partial [Methanobacteriota archaeon]
KQKINKRNWFGLFGVFVWIILTVILLGIPGMPKSVDLLISVILGIGLIKLFTSPKLRVLSGSLLLLIVIMIAYGQLGHGVEFFPEVDPPRVFVNIESPSGTNLDMSNRIAKMIEKRLDPMLETDVREYVANVGSSNNPFDAGSSTPNKSTITVQYVDFNKRSQSSTVTTNEIRQLVKNIAGADIEVKKQDMGPPVGLPINIEISGDDYNELGFLASKITDIIKNVPGVVDIKDDYDSGKPEIRIKVNREKAALFSANTSKIANAIRSAINGTEASTYRVNEDEYDITVRLKKDQRDNVDALRNMRIIYNNMRGTTLGLPLSSVADIEYGTGPAAIKRKDLKRVITVSANVEEGYNANAVLEQCKAELADFTLPQDYKIEFTGQNKEQAKASAFLSRAFMIALLGIFLILVIQFNSLSQPVMIMIAVLISLIGVFVGL